MKPTKEELRKVILQGRNSGSTHVIIVWDQFDGENYPVYVRPDQDVKKVAELYDGVNMQKIDEVYSMSLDLEDQLEEHRTFHYE